MADVLVLTKNLSTGASEAMTKLKVDNTNGQLKSSTPTGTPPMTIASTDLVTNLNADLLDGNHAAAFATANHMQSATYGGTGISTAALTGVPVISSGTWSVDTNALAGTHGGTGHTTTSVGDLLVGAATNTWNKLTIGTNGQVLTSNGTTAGWATPAAAPNSFETMSCPAGTNPVADSGTDTLSWTSSGGTLVITGNATTDTINLDLAAAYQLPAGATGNTLYYSSGWIANTNILMTSTTLKALDSASVVLGTGNDDSIVHNGTNTVWTHSTGNLTIDNINATGFTDMQLGTDTSATGFRVKNDTGTNVFQVLGNQNIYLGAGTGCNVAVALVDNAGPALSIAQGADNYLSIYTSNGTEGISLGNASTNPTITQTGTGQVTLSGNVNATLGLDVTGADLTVGGANFAVGVDGIVDAGTWQATSVKLGYGGTGITSATTGDILFYNSAVSTTAYQKLGIGSTGALLNIISGLPAWSTAPTAAGDILYWNGTAWTKLASGGASTCLTSNGAGVLSWADPGGGYTWTVAGDAGTPQAVNDGNTATFAGGLGITTSAGATRTLTVTADTDGVTLINNGGTGSVQLAVNTNGIAEAHIDWAATGATKIHSTNIPYNTSWSPVNLGTIGTTYPTQDSLKSITDVFAAIDLAIGNVAAGLTFKGPAFSKYQFVTGTGITGTALKQGQAVSFTLGKANATDVFKIYDGTTTRTYTAVSGTPSSMQFDVSGTISQMVQSLAAAIEADASKIVRAQASNFPELDNTNNVLVLSGISTLTTFQTYASVAAGGTPWGFPCYYITAFNGTSGDDQTIMPAAQQVGSNFSAVIDQSALNDGDTYVSRSCGCWERWDNTDNEWVTIMVSPSQQYVGGDGITIDTTTEPDAIKVNLASNPGLEFDPVALRVKLNGSTLLRGSSGLSVNPATDVGWTTVSQTFNAGVKSDTVAEVTATVGVAVDGCRVKDGYADGSCWLVSPASSAGTGGVAVGDIVYLTASKTVIKAKADSTTTGFVFGVSNSVASSGQPCDIIMAGGYEWSATAEVQVNVQTTSGYAVGDKLYVSKVTAGTAHNTVAAYVAGDWIQCIGKITDVTKQGSGNVYAILSVEEPYVLV